MRVLMWLMIGLTAAGLADAAEITDAYALSSARIVCEYGDNSRLDVHANEYRADNDVVSGRHPFGEIRNGRFEAFPSEMLEPFCPAESGRERRARERQAGLAAVQARQARTRANWYSSSNGPRMSAQRGPNGLSISLNCQTETGHWYITFETRGYVTALDELVDVSIQFDGGERVPAKWQAYDTDTIGPGHTVSADFVARFKNAERLQLGVANYRGQWQYADYSTGGDRPPFAVTAPCGIDW